MKLDRTMRDLWRAAGLTPRRDAAQRNGIVCLDPDPDLPDPKRASRFRAKGGTLVAMLIREKVMQERREDFLRVKAMGVHVPSGPDGDDHGNDLGPAAQARFTGVDRVGGRIRGAAQKDATPVYARMVDAADLFERLNASSQISDRQAKAGRRLLALKRAAGIDGRVTARYPAVPSGIPDDGEDADEVVEAICPDGYDPRTYHRWVLRQLPPLMAGLVDRACDWTPDYRVGRPEMRFLATFQVALDRLGDVFGLER